MEWYQSVRVTKEVQTLRERAVVLRYTAFLYCFNNYNFSGSVLSTGLIRQNFKLDCSSLTYFIITYKNKLRNAILIDYSELIVMYGLVNVNTNETQVS